MALKKERSCINPQRAKPFDITELLDVVEHLKGKYVIVEGKKDEEALRSLGVENIVKIAQENIHSIPFTLNSNKEIVILTDFDKAGRKLAVRANNVFKAHKLKVNPHLRKRFMSLGKTRVEDFRLFLRELSLQSKL